MYKTEHGHGTGKFREPAGWKACATVPLSNARLIAGFRFGDRLRLRSRPKQRGAQADNRGALFDRHLEISGHAHAQIRQRRAELAFTAFSHLPRLAEHREYLLRVVRTGSNP